MSNSDPPVIVSGGSLKVELNPRDFRKSQQHKHDSENDLVIDSVVVDDGQGNVQTIPLGKDFTVTFRRASPAQP